MLSLATVRLNLKRIEQKGLPPSCIRCGMEAERFHFVTYRYLPGPLLLWIVLMLYAHIVHIIIIRQLAKEKSLWMPLCATHHEQKVRADTRKNQRVLLVLALSGLIFATGVAVAIGTLLKGEATTDQAWGIVLGSLLLAGLICGAGACIIIVTSMFGRTRATEITSDSITLAGVSGEFALAVADYGITD